MPSMDIIMDGTGCWPELRGRAKVVHTLEPIAVAALPRGMQTGEPSVTLRIELPDGTTVLAETSMRLFLSVARAFSARYGG